MQGRVLRLTPGFRRARQALRVQAGSQRAIALASAIRGLAAGQPLPAPNDVEVEFAPTRAWSRRVGNENLWIVFRFDEQHVTLLSLVAQPPVPMT